MLPFLKEQIEALYHLIFAVVEEEGKEAESETFPEKCITLVLLALVLTLFTPSCREAKPSKIH